MDSMLKILRNAPLSKPSTYDWWWCECEKPTGVYADCTTCGGFVLARAWRWR